jgi:hypothetical protein
MPASPFVAPPPGTGPAPQQPVAYPPAPAGFNPNQPPPIGFVDGPIEPRTPSAVEIQPSWHVGLEYLGWVTSKQQTPALVTSGPVTDPNPAALGQPDTKIVLGGNDLSGNFHSGVRLNLGYDLDADHTWQIGGSYFILEERTGQDGITGNGAPGSNVLARPFYNANAGQQDADPISVPGTMKGTFTADTPLRFNGGDLNIRWLALDSGATGARVAFLAGFRYLSLDEKLLIGENLVDLPGLGAAGNQYMLHENFTTYDRFYGGQVGCDYEYRFGMFYVDALAKLGIGPTDETIAASANSRIIEPTTVVTSNNRALLVQPSNNGKYNRTEFSVVPEVGLTFGLQFNEYLSLGVGYNFLYWNQVARPGKSVDTTINIQALQAFDQIGPARPALTNAGTTDFWAQGFSLSMQVNF